jgi:hypothetical protein
MFTAHSRARVMNIHYQLSTLKKGDSSIADYFHKFTGLIATLAAINKPLTDEEQISFLLAGLGSEFESFVTMVQMRTDLLSVEALYGHLLSHELRMAQAQPKVDLTLAGAHFASRGVSSSHGNRGGRFSNTSHTGSTSFSSGQRTNRGRSRGRGSSTNGSRPTCQICGKFGHTALTCYHRFDNSYSSDSNMQALLVMPQPPVVGRRLIIASSLMLFKLLAILLTAFLHLLFKINLILKNCFTVLLIIYFSKLLGVLVGLILGHIILINSNPVLYNVCFWVIVFFTVATNVFTSPLVVSTSHVMSSFLKLCFHFLKIILLHHLHFLISPCLYLGRLQWFLCRPDHSQMPQLQLPSIHGPLP